MNFRTTSSIVGIGGLIVGLIGVGLTIAFFVLQRSESAAPALELRMTSSTKLEPPTNPLGGRLTVHLDGQPVEDLWLTTLRLANVGNSDIGQGDFSEPLKFSTGGVIIEEIIVPAGGGSANISAQISRTSEGMSIIIEPLLLKRRESVSFSALSKTVLDNIRAPQRVPIKDVERIHVVPIPGEIRAEASIVVLDVIIGVVGLVASLLLAFMSFTVLQLLRRNRSRTPKSEGQMKAHSI